jgi:hypothetical protein
VGRGRRPQLCTWCARKSGEGGAGHRGACEVPGARGVCQGGPDAKVWRWPRGSTCVHGRTWSGVRATSPVLLSLAPFDCNYLQKFELRCTEVQIVKL